MRQRSIRPGAVPATPDRHGWACGRSISPEHARARRSSLEELGLEQGHLFRRIEALLRRPFVLEEERLHVAGHLLSPDIPALDAIGKDHRGPVAAMHRIVLEPEPRVGIEITPRLA